MACCCCCRAHLTATGGCVAVWALMGFAPSLNCPKSSGMSSSLKAFYDGTMDVPGVDDSHVRERRPSCTKLWTSEVLGSSSPSDHRQLPSCWRFNPLLPTASPRLLPFHCGGMDSRQHGDNVASLPQQGQQPCRAAAVIDTTPPPHIEVLWHELPLQPGCAYCICPLWLQQMKERRWHIPVVNKQLVPFVKTAAILHQMKHHFCGRRHVATVYPAAGLVLGQSL